MTRFGRALVIAEPQALYTAQDMCTITFWVVSAPVDDQEPTTVYLGTSKESASFNVGTPLEKATKYVAELNAGDTLWVITPDIAQMGFMVTE